MRTVTINITPVNDNAPVITSNGGGVSASINVAEDSTAVTTVVATDADPLTYTLSGDDAAKFNLDVAGALTFKTPPDYENPTDTNANNTYELTVAVSDGTYTTTQALTVNVTAVGEGATANADTLTIREDTDHVPIDVLANDSVPDGVTSLSLATSPTRGTATVTGNKKDRLHTERKRHRNRHFHLHRRRLVHGHRDSQGRHGGCHAGRNDQPSRCLWPVGYRDESRRKVRLRRQPGQEQRVGHQDRQ